MALFKDTKSVTSSSSDEFDKLRQPGNAAPFAGIYKCVVCGHEIGIAEGHTLPTQTHTLHDPKKGKIEWKLLVFAQHNVEQKKPVP